MPLQLERLEDRTLLSTLELTGGVLQYDAGSDVTNDLTVSYAGPNYTFVEGAGGENITLGATLLGLGWAGSGTKTVSGAEGGTSSIVINLGNLADSLTLQSLNDTTTVNAGTENDTITVGNAGTLDGIAASVTVNGDGGTDSLAVSDSADATADTYQITNSAVARTGGPTINYATVESVGLSTGLGVDTINVESTASGTPVSVDAGGDNDITTISGTAHDLDNIAGAVTINSGLGLDSLTVQDSADGGNNTYTITGTTIQRTGTALITYSPFSETVALNTGTGNDAISINVGDNGSTVYTIDGDGHTTGDSLTVDAQGQGVTFAPGSVTVAGYGAVNYANIESLAVTSAGSAYTVNGSGGNNELVVTATTDNDGSFQLDAEPVISFTNMTSLLFEAGAGDDTLTINNPVAGGVFAPTSGITYHGGAQTTGDDLVLSGGGGAGFTETYTVATGDPAGGTITTTDGIAPTQTITFNGLEPITDDVAAATLTVNATNAADTITVDNNGARVRVTVAGFEAISFSNKTNVIVNAGLTGADLADGVTVDFATASAGLSSLTVNGGTGGDTLNVRATPALVTTTVNGDAGNDTINVGSAGSSLDGIAGAVTANGGTETDTLNINDQGDGDANNYTVTGTTIDRSGMPQMTYGTVETLVLNSGAGANVIGVSGSSAATTVNAGAGDDTITVGNGTLDNIDGAVTVNGDGNTDSLTVDDSTDPDGSTYLITTTTVDRTGMPQLTFATVESLAVNTSDGDDTINVETTAAATPVVLDAGDGNDTIAVSGTANDLDNILGTVNVSGAAGTADTLTVNDDLDAGPSTYTITTTTVNRTGMAQITYGTLEGLTVDASTGGDTITINSTAVDTPVTINANAGDDTINLNGNNNTVTLNAGTGDDAITVGNGTLDSVGGGVTVNGDAHTVGDTLTLNDSGDPNSHTYTITGTTISRNLTGTITYGTVETLNVNTGPSGETVSVQGTSVTTNLTTGAGDDIITVGNGSNSLADIDAQLTIDTGAGDDLLTVNDSGNTGNYPISPNNAVLDAAGGYGTLTRFATGLIRYVYNVGVPANGLEDLVILGAQGGNYITVNATSAWETTALDSGIGSEASSVTINADGLSAANTFTGNTGADHFIFNITTDIGSTALFPTLSVQIEGNGHPVNERDVLDFNENSGTLRTVDFLYVANGMDISGFTCATFASGVVNVLTMETVKYNGTGVDDIITVTGQTGVDDVISVVPGPAVTGLLDSALVFYGGDPFLGPPQTFTTSDPGVAGGGTSPDLLMDGIASLTVRGEDPLAANTDNDKLIIYTRTENAVVSADTTDPFGFGVGILIGATTNPNAYDNILVTDALVRVVDDFVTPTDVLIPVTVTTTTFVPFTADPLLFHSLTVNAGDEVNKPNTPLTDTADVITATISTSLGIQINGNNPDATRAPDGDKLIVVAPGEINIWADVALPTPNVTISSSVGGVSTAGLGWSSIESLLLVPVNGLVNIIGDNNTVGVDQDDTYVIVGQDTDFGLGLLTGDDTDGANEFVLSINGSPDIGFTAVSYLRIFGQDQFVRMSTDLLAIYPAGTDLGSGDDTLTITPYADNTPTGWGIDVRFDGGNPTASDIINYIGVAGVLDEITVQPSAEGDGQIIVPNVVTIDYNDTEILTFQSNNYTYGDSDTLTLNGTDGVTTPASGNDAVTATVVSAGTNLDVVMVDRDSVSGVNLIRLNAFNGFDTLYIDTLAGNDTLTVDSTVGPSPIALNYDGGLGSDSLTLTGGTATADNYYVGPLANEGHSIISITGSSTSGTQRVNFRNLEPVIDNIAGPLTVNATDADNAISYTVGSVTTNGKVTVDAFESIEFTNKTALTLNALGGSDVISLNNAYTPTGLPDMTINGGDPTGSDTLVVSGTTGADTLRFNPWTTLGSGTVTVVGLPMATFTGIERVKIDGQGGDDGLIVTGPAANLRYTVQPGAAVDSGAVLVNGLVPMEYKGLGSAGGVTVNAIAGVNELVMEGTAFDDAFTVTESTAILNSQLTVTYTEMDRVTLKGGDSPETDSATINATAGADTLTVALGTMTVSGLGTTPTTVGLDGIEVLTVTGQGGADTIDVTQVGQAPPAGATSKLIVVNLDAEMVTATGTALSDTIAVTPNGSGAGQFQAVGVQGPVVGYNNVTNVITFAGGTGGFDVVQLIGTEDANTVSTASATQPRIDGSTVTIGAGIDRLDVFTLGGDDTVDLSTPGYTSTPTVIDGGTGNDTVTGTAQVDVIYGGEGNDTLNGLGGNDILYGGEGTDTLNGGAGNDRLLGEEGNDTLTGGTGDDAILGGDGSDAVVWADGDGTDTVDGGTGEDTLTMTLNPGATTVSVTRSGDRVTVTQGASMWANMGEIENLSLSTGSAANTVVVNDVTGTALNRIDVNTEGGADTVTVNTLTGAEAAIVNVDVGSGDTGDAVIINAGVGADTVHAAMDGSVIDVGGLSNRVRISNTTAVDSLRINGGDGNDTIKVSPGVETNVAVTLYGNAGNDNLSADAIIYGGDGNDTLEGGSGNDTLYGEAGNDTLIVTAGTDTLNGGTGKDLAIADANTDFVLLGTVASSTLTATSLGVSTLVNVEEVNLTGGVNNNTFIINFPGTVRLDGYWGNDFFLIGDLTTGSLEITGGTGSDTINFSDYDVGIRFDMDNATTRQKVASTGLTIRLTELIENLIGSDSPDIVRVDALAEARSVDLGDPTGPDFTLNPPGNFGDTPADYLFFDGQDMFVTIERTGVPAINGTATAFGYEPVTFTNVERLKVENSEGMTSAGDGFESAFTQSVNYPLDVSVNGRKPQAVVIGDVDDDGNNDLVVVTSSPGQVNVMLGDGYGAFGPAIAITTKTTRLADGTKIKGLFDVALGDMDDDGDLDIVIASRGRGNQANVAVLFNDGTGAFPLDGINNPAAGYYNVLVPGVTGTVLGIQLGDLVGGEMFTNPTHPDPMSPAAAFDVVVSGNKRIAALINNGMGTLAIGSTMAISGRYARGVQVTDVDNDGYADILASNYVGNRVDVFLNEGVGVFGPTPDQTVSLASLGSGRRPTSLTVGDFDNDGWTDFAVSNALGNSFSVAMNNGLSDGSFTLQTQPTILPHRYQSITAGDMNGDGKTDIVLASNNSNTIMVMLSVGNGTFSTPFQFAVGNVKNRQPSALAVDDLNHDGSLDIVIADAGNNRISVLLQNPVI